MVPEPAPSRGSADSRGLRHEAVCLWASPVVNRRAWRGAAATGDVPRTSADPACREDDRARPAPRRHFIAYPAVLDLQMPTRMRLELIAIASVLVGGSGCAATGHGCHRDDGALAFVDAAFSLVELGLTVASAVSESAPPSYVAAPARPPGQPVYGRLVSRADGSSLAGVALGLYRQGVWVDRATSRMDGGFSFPHLYDAGFYAISFESRPEVPLATFDLVPGASFQVLSY